MKFLALLFVTACLFTGTQAISKKKLKKEIKELEAEIAALKAAEGSWSSSGWGDPIMTGFDGATFEFQGEVGAYYNLISEREHQVSMKLKLGEMWDHNGTYMEGIGFRYRDHQVIVELDVLDNMEVYLDGKRLRMSNGETEQEHVLALESGELMVLWQLHRPDVGQAVEITSDMISLTVFVTPAGTRDQGGVLQPAYLNFDAQLLGPPAPGMKGIVGSGYERMLAKDAAFNAEAADDFAGHEEEYRMAGYADTNHLHNSFGVVNAVNPKRHLAERASIAFPLKFGRHAALSMPFTATLPEPEVKVTRKLLAFF